MKRQLSFLVACIAVTALLAGSATAAVVYSDSFSRTTGSGDPNGKPANPNNFSSWGANDNALGGTVTQTYFVGPTNRGGGANQTTDGNVGTLISGGTMFDFDVTTVAAQWIQCGV